MVIVNGTNIISALGTTSQQCYESVRKGNCALLLHDASKFNVSDDLWASTVDTDSLPEHGNFHTTRLEKMALNSIAAALDDAANAQTGHIDPTDADTIFILSTTKGNIDLLDSSREDIPADRVYLSRTASFISTTMGNGNQPIVVSNACISGLSALIVAKRLLDSNLYRNAIVVGVDELTRFTISGFQSFKALSPCRCQPFDANRQGLNLGEAAATMILTRVDKLSPGQWTLQRGSMHNDANHISGPSRVGEGSYLCLKDLTEDFDTSIIANINAHGTATQYNDEMESIAINRAGLAHIPVNAYKGYIGHTLGAAGILECILSMKSLDNSLISATAGYETCGVSNNLDIVSENRPTDNKCFIKMLSGFGGSNAALMMRKEV
ncbi:MAG: hypothetical protein NC082_04330 [Clostridiales bacterium]|nr:hypothetical protein [Clostridiales bacterium]